VLSSLNNVLGVKLNYPLNVIPPMETYTSNQEHPNGGSQEWGQFVAILGNLAILLVSPSVQNT